MDSEQANNKINGSKTQEGNYVWGGALTLAWKELIEKIIKQPIRIKSESYDSLAICKNFNESLFNNKMLSENSFYACSGFGNSTVEKINYEVQKKFPSKTTAKLTSNLSPTSIISYAYFYKKLKFLDPFTKKSVQFNEKQVNGFQATTNAQKKQILVHKYYNDRNFVLQLLTNVKDQQIFIVMLEKKQEPTEVLKIIQQVKSESAKNLASADCFQMPNVKIQHKRNVPQLQGVYLMNKKFESYFFGQIIEIINFQLNQSGVKVQNEGVIKLYKAKLIRPPQIKRLIVNKPFWIIMRQKKNHPYFVANVNYI